MKYKKRSLKTHNTLITTHPEQGILIPTTAILAALLLFFLITYQIDSSMVKRARAQAQKEVDFICAVAASELPIMRLAVIEASTQVTLLRENLSVRIPRTRFADTNPVLFTGPTEPAYPPVTGSTYQPAGGLSDATPPSEGWCSGCDFVADTAASAPPNGNYPPLFWDNILDYGNKIGCEFNLLVQTVLSGEKPLRVKSAQQIVPRDDIVPGEMRGMTIVLAPHLVTNASTGSGPADPTFEFSGTPPMVFFDPDRPSKNTFTGPDPVSGQSGYGGRPLRLSERRTSCMNPLKAAANTIAAGLLARNARTSLYRQNTMLLLAGTRSIRNTSAGLAPDPNAAPVSPEIIVDAGDDILTSYYAIPEVRYKNLSTGTEISENDCPDFQMRCKQAYQLKSCFHLYGDPNVTGPGISKPDDYKALNNTSFGQVDFSSRPWATYPETYVPGISPWYAPEAESIQLNAEELAGVLPAIQYNVDRPDKDDYDLSVAGTAILQADLLGTMQFINSSSNPIPDSHVVIILHQTVTDLGYATRIRAEVDALNMRGVWIDVIFMPPNEAELALYRNLGYAFGTHDIAGTPLGGTQNFLVVLAPDLTGIDPLDYPAEFRNYWEMLLNFTDREQKTAIEFNKTFYNSRIIRSEVLL